MFLERQERKIVVFIYDYNCGECSKKMLRTFDVQQYITYCLVVSIFI